MNIVIGLIVILVLAWGLGGYSNTVERRHEQASRAVTSNLDEGQREQCESWRGWPKHWHPAFCEY